MWTGWILFSFLACCSSAEYYTNPIKKTSASDPFIQYYNGYFYYMATTWTELIITRAKTINGLKTGQSKTVYKETGGERCCNIWAPGKALQVQVVAIIFHTLTNILERSMKSTGTGIYISLRGTGRIWALNDRSFSKVRQTTR